jgi:hypothetical protein
VVFQYFISSLKQKRYNELFCFLKKKEITPFALGYNILNNRIIINYFINCSFSNDAITSFIDYQIYFICFITLIIRCLVFKRCLIIKFNGETKNRHNLVNFRANKPKFHRRNLRLYWNKENKNFYFWFRLCALSQSILHRILKNKPNINFRIA